jgi:Neuraminidase (sialidase)
MSEIPYLKDAEGQNPPAFVAVDLVCAWPNLTPLDDVTILVVIHNKPSHLREPSDVDCYASEDGGHTWSKRGTPGPRDNEFAARGNVAAGVAPNGDIVVVCSGWDDPTAESNRGNVLPVMVSHSGDDGYTWKQRMDAFPGEWPEAAIRNNSPQGHLIPFGDILPGADGKLRVGMYSENPGGTQIYSSADNGITWDDPVPYSDDAVIHEPSLLYLGKGRWLSAVRFDGLDLYVSEDDARTWVNQQTVSKPKAFPGHLLRLKSGKILLTYGNRNDPKGIDMRLSADEGKTWSKPRRLVGFTDDGGYPSSVQLKNGEIVTCYYAKETDYHPDYHMGTVIWKEEWA